MGKCADLSGKKFNRLFVIERVENNRHGKSQWRCRCDCGNEIIAVGSSLSSGNTKSCGCLKRESASIRSTKNISGLQFGRLTVLERAGSDKNKQATWLCKCSCGNEVIVNGHSLLSGATKSCGCYHSEVVIKRNKSNAIHGETGTRLYKIWVEMRRRCNNPKRDSYRRYGGRGITVCSAWSKDFLSFKEWALSHGYQNDLSIDRIDNNKGYNPDNCRWATVKEQSNNRSTNPAIITMTEDGNALFAGVGACAISCYWKEHDITDTVYIEVVDVPVEIDWKCEIVGDDSIITGTSETYTAKFYQADGTTEDETITPVWSLDIPSAIRSSVSISGKSGKTVTLKAASGTSAIGKSFGLNLTDSSGQYHAMKTITIKSWL